MGGWGSGNRLRWSTKCTCEEQTRIELPYLRRSGFLRPGYHGYLSWNRNGEPSGTINFKTHEAGIQLIYSAREGDEDWKSINEFVPFQWTDQHLGGQRQWLTCLSCGHRCSVLYGGVYYRCRECWNLTYQSRNEDRADRMRRRLSKIHLRLGGSGDQNDWLPDKPKGMHWRTYSRLAKEYLEVDGAIEDELIALLARFESM